MRREVREPRVAGTSRSPGICPPLTAKAEPLPARELREVLWVCCQIRKEDDVVVAANAGQQTPNGYYCLERMLKGLLARGAKVLLCGTCMDARGMQDEHLVEGSRRSTMDQLAEATLSAEKVLVF